MSGLQVSDYRKRTPEMMQECFAEIFTLYESGQIKPAPITRFSLEDYQSAFTQVRDRTAQGRLILDINKEDMFTGFRHSPE